MIRRGKEEERREGGGEARLSVEYLLCFRNLGDCFMCIISSKLHHFIVKKQTNPKHKYMNFQNGQTLPLSPFY